MSVQVMDWTGHGSKTAEFDIPIRAGVSERSEAVFVLFDRDDVDLNDAVGVLRKEGLDVYLHENSLQIRQDRQPAFRIQLRWGDDIRAMASQLRVEADEAQILENCVACFEIAIYDSEESLDNPELITKISRWLQRLTGGFTYQTWNQQLTPPE